MTGRFIYISEEEVEQLGVIARLLEPGEPCEFLRSLADRHSGAITEEEAEFLAARAEDEAKQLPRSLKVSGGHWRLLYKSAAAKLRAPFEAGGENE